MMLSLQAHHDGGNGGASVYCERFARFALRIGYERRRRVTARETRRLYLKATYVPASTVNRHEGHQGHKGQRILFHGVLGVGSALLKPSTCYESFPSAPLRQRITNGLTTA